MYAGFNTLTLKYTLESLHAESYVDMSGVTVNHTLQWAHGPLPTQKQKGKNPRDLFLCTTKPFSEKGKGSTVQASSGL